MEPKPLRHAHPGYYIVEHPVRLPVKKGVFLGGSPPGKAYLGQLLAGGPCFRLPPQKGPQKVAPNPQIREVPTCKTCRSGGDRDITGPTHKNGGLLWQVLVPQKGPRKGPKKGPQKRVLF